MIEGLKQRHKRAVANATGYGFDSHSRKKIYFHFLTLVTMQSAMLSSTTQHAMRPKNRRKMENGSVLIDSQIFSAYPAMCGLQREAKNILFYRKTCISQVLPRTHPDFNILIQTNLNEVKSKRGQSIRD